MWVPGKIALTAAVCGAAALAACSGPLDSPTPRPPVVHDAGSDFRRDVAAADRGSGGAGGVALIPDASVESVSDAFDARDGRPDGAAGSRVDGGVGGFGGRGAGGRSGVGGGGGFGGVGGSWPVVPGCVTGLPPQPTILAGDVGDLVVGCPSLTRTVARLLDMSRRGMLFSAALDPPLDGFSVWSPGMLCAGTDTAPIMVTALDVSSRLPVDNGVVSVRITILGPNAPLFPPIRLAVRVVAMDFFVEDDVIDFGLVPVGTSRSNPVTVMNQFDSAAIAALYPSPQMTDAFTLLNSVGPDGLPQLLEPGLAGTPLIAYFFPAVVGAYQSTFNISPFVPGTEVDPTCGGMVHTLTLRAQAYQAR